MDWPKNWIWPSDGQLPAPCKKKFRSGKFGPPPELNFEPRSTFFGKSWQKLVQKLYHLNFWARDEVFSDTLWVPYFQDRLDTVWIIDNSCLFGNLKNFLEIFGNLGSILTSLWLHFFFTFSSLFLHFFFTWLHFFFTFSSLFLHFFTFSSLFLHFFTFSSLFLHLTSLFLHFFFTWLHFFFTFSSLFLH